MDQSEMCKQKGLSVTGGSREMIIDDHLYLLAEDTLILSSDAVVTVVNPLQPVDNAVETKGN